jgi:hypothetical protein
MEERLYKGYDIVDQGEYTIVIDPQTFGIMHWAKSEYGAKKWVDRHGKYDVDGQNNNRRD